jgi:hypothetical protein
MVNESQRRLFGFLRFIGQTYIYPILIIAMVRKKEPLTSGNFFNKIISLVYTFCETLLWPHMKRD